MFACLGYLLLTLAASAVNVPFAWTSSAGPLARLPRAEVNTVEDAFQWVDHAFQRVAAAGVFGTTPTALEGRSVGISTCFSGIGSPEIACRAIQNGHREFLLKRGEDGAKGITFLCRWAIEKSIKAQAELLHLRPPPTHVFRNIFDLLPCQRHREVGLGRGASEPNPDTLKAWLPKVQILRRAQCIACGHPCTLQATDVHVAGSPCTGHSSYGERGALSSVQAKLFYLWLALVQAFQFAVAIHENVPQFGEEDLLAFLSGTWLVLRLLICPSALGWPIARSRQYCLALRKDVVQMLIPVPRTVASLCPRMLVQQLEEFRHAVFDRTCNVTFHVFFVAGDSEVEQEKQWARSRPGTLGRYAGADAHNDMPGSCLTCLTAAERERWATASNIDPLALWDLGQDPLARPNRSRQGILPCLVSGAGIQYCGEKGRWLLMREHFVSMGFPVYASQQQAMGGSTCQFSDGQQAPKSRTRASGMHQAGNTMHVNASGVALLMSLWCLPHLGASELPGTSQRRAGEPDSGFARAFKRMTQ